MKEVGVRPAEDNKTISVSADGVVSLLGAATAAKGTLPMLDSETGKLTWKTLEDIGAGDGDTTYEIEPLRKNKIDENGADTGEEDPEGEIYGIKYREIPLGATEEEKTAILWTKIPFNVYTESEVDAAIKEVADLVGVPAEDDDSTDTLYERIAAEILRATKAESALSDRIGAAKDGETAATGVYAYVDGVVNALVNGVDPDKIDSLNELIAWVEAHPAIVEELDGRLNKVEDILDGFGGENEPQNVKEYVDDTFAEKATSLAGYGIVDAYTKKQIDENVIGTPGKPELKDAQGAVTQEKVDGTGIFVNAYSKEEVNALISQVSGGSSETAASVKLQLDTYKSTNDARSLVIEKEIWGVDKDGNVNSITGDSRIDTIEDKLDGIEAKAEVNIVETVQVNGTALTPDKDRAVNIVINSDTLADGAALKKSITDAAALAQTGVNNAATAQGTADTALQNAGNNTTLIENLTKATTGGHEGDTSSLAYQIGQLQAHNTEHANEFGILKGRVDTNEETLKNKANSSDVYTKAQIGTFDTNTTTIVKMIEDEAKRADAAEKTNANAIATIYHKEGDADATGILAEEIARATAAEKVNAEAIAALAGTDNKSTVKANADAIAMIQGGDTNKSMRTVAREEANLVATAAMEFKGAISELPTNLDENNTGHFYKVIKDIPLSSNEYSIANIDHNFSWGMNISESTVINYEVPNANLLNDTEFEVALEFAIDPPTTEAHSGWQPEKIEVLLTSGDADSGDLVETQTIAINLETGVGKTTYSAMYVPHTCAIRVTAPDGTDGGNVYVKNLICTIVNPISTDNTVIKAGDSVVWNGASWYVIPSGDDLDDTWRPITFGDVPLATKASLNVKAGESIAIKSLTPSGTFEIAAIHATMEKYGTVIGYAESQTIGEEVVTKNMIKMDDGKITEVSTDLLVNGFKTLILSGGSATV